MGSENCFPPACTQDSFAPPEIIAVRAGKQRLPTPQADMICLNEAASGGGILFKMLDRTFESEAAMRKRRNYAIVTCYRAQPWRG